MYIQIIHSIGGKSWGGGPWILVKPLTQKHAVVVSCLAFSINRKHNFRSAWGPHYLYTSNVIGCGVMSHASGVAFQCGSTAKIRNTGANSRCCRTFDLIC